MPLVSLPLSASGLSGLDLLGALVIYPRRFRSAGCFPGWSSSLVGLGFPRGELFAMGGLWVGDSPIRVLLRWSCLCPRVPSKPLQVEDWQAVTVVAGLVVPNGRGWSAWIGGDSLSSNEDGLASLAMTPKVARFGDLLLGFAGSWRAGSQFFAVAARAHLPSLAQLLESVKLDEETKGEWELLAIERTGSGVRLYEVNSDRGVVETRPSREGVTYGAIGSGGAVCLGALAVSTSEDPDEGALMMALEATEKHSTTVRSPFLIVSL